MRYDEAANFCDYSSKPYYVGLSSYSYSNNHVFHTFLVHVVYSILGNRPWIIRLPALSAGLLCIPALYFLIRRFFNKDAALLAAGFAASSSALIEYSTNARGYTLVCLTFLLIFAVAIYLRETNGLGLWALFVILSALGFFTVPIMLYPFGIVVVWLFLSCMVGDIRVGRGLFIKRLFVAGLAVVFLTGILYLPAFVFSDLGSIFSWGYMKPKSWSAFASTFLPSAELVWNQWNRDIPSALSIVMVIGFFVASAFHYKVSKFRMPIVVAGIVWLIPAVAAYRTIIYPRVWLFLLPLYLGLASSGIIALSEPVVAKLGKWRHIAIPFLAVALSIVLSFNVVHNNSFYRSSETMSFVEAEEMAIFLKSYLRPGDSVLAVGTFYCPLRYYFKLHEIPDNQLVDRLNPNSKRPNRLLVVANEVALKTAGSSGGEVIQEIFPNFTAARPVKTFGDRALYETYSMENSGGK